MYTLNNLIIFAQCVGVIGCAQVSSSLFLLGHSRFPHIGAVAMAWKSAYDIFSLNHEARSGLTYVLAG
jgi:hypothetical protein